MFSLKKENEGTKRLTACLVIILKNNFLETIYGLKGWTDFFMLGTREVTVPKSVTSQFPA